MPFSPQTVGAAVNCFKDCPICWSITERNIQRMIAGESIVLGTWVQLVSFALPGKDEDTGAEQGACALCASLAAHIGKIEGNQTYMNGATISISIDNDSKKENHIDSKRYLERLTIEIKNPKRDVWQDPEFRTKYLESDPDYFKTVNEWVTQRSYTFHMAFFTNGGPTEHYVQQRMASPEVASEAAFTESRGWIRDCILEHEHCPKNAAGYLPSRVLDLAMSNGPVDTIKVKESDHMQMGMYVALSYCWGAKAQAKMLKKESLGAFKAGIQVRELPQSLRDAILVTRHLGMRYLWIDSLCIIQDSDEDKAKELSQMPRIYKNAIVTISAAIADDCRNGFLQDRPEIIGRIENSYCLPLVWDVLQPDGERASEVWLCPDDKRGFEIKDYEEEAIESRAWTFQEAWLAPRLLVYGSGPVQWRCLSAAYTQGLKEGKSKSSMPQYQDREKFFLDPIEVAAALPLDEQMRGLALETPFPAWLESWFVVASHYSKRQLTYQSDKLPALSAIAAEFSRMYADQYLAGIWKRSLPWALLWHCVPHQPPKGPINTFTNTSVDEQEQERARRLQHLDHLTMPQIRDLAAKYTRSVSIDQFQKTSRSKAQKRPEGSSMVISSSPSSPAHTYIAPTWSFASVERGIRFASHEWDGPHHTLITIQHASTTPENSMVPFSKVINGSITLTGPMQRLSADEVLAFFVVVDSDEWPHIYWDYIIPDDSKLGREVLEPFVERQKQEEMASVNSQLGITQRVTRKMMRAWEVLPEAEKRSSQPLPQKGEFEPLGREDRPRTGERELYLLRVTWTEIPRGLVLVRRGRDEGGIETFERVGFFAMGREDYERTDWRMRGEQNAGKRDWDWSEGLKMYTFKMV